MQGVAASLLYLALGASLLAGYEFASAERAPAPAVAEARPEAGPAREAIPDDFQLQAQRLADRARLEEALANARPPVPVLREWRPEPWVAPDIPDGATAAAAPVAEPKRQKTPEVAKAKIEEDGYRSVRLLQRDADGKWRAVAMRGNTEVAILVDAQGNVSYE